METGTEKPAPERVLFQSPYTRFQVHLRREQRGFTTHGVVEVIPALIAEFHDGLYETADPEIARLMRESHAYKRGDVFEARAEVFGEVKPPNVRGPVSAKDLTGTKVVPRNRADAPVRPALKTKTTKCDICGAEFEDDIRGAKVKMHRVGAHRRSLAKPEPQEPGSLKMEEGPGA